MAFPPKPDRPLSIDEAHAALTAPGMAMEVVEENRNGTTFKVSRVTVLRGLQSREVNKTNHRRFVNDSSRSGKTRCRRSARCGNRPPASATPAGNFSFISRPTAAKHSAYRLPRRGRP